MDAEPTCLTNAVCVEIFCGKGGLSKRLRAKQFQVISVDHLAPKGIPVLRIDISKKSQRDVLEQLLALDTILYVHFAPPCGTASAARNIKPGPPPLRSTIFPMGLPGLNFVQQTRVKKANFLYKWTWKLINFLDSKNIGWSVENPASSLMWITDPFVEMVQQLQHFDAFSFHTCMFSAKRKKDTAIWTSVPQLRAYLERKCDGSHQHLQWGRTEKGFATAEECAYNDNLCASWAEAITAFALTRNYVVPPSTIQDVQQATHSVAHINKAILGCLPRGRKLVPMMSEFLQPQIHDISARQILQQLPLGKRIPDVCTPFPKGSRLLKFVNEDGGGLRWYRYAHVCNNWHTQGASRLFEGSMQGGPPNRNGHAGQQPPDRKHQGIQRQGWIGV